SGIGPGPDGGVWYKLHDELNEAEYYVQAEHLRPVQSSELTPISPDVPDAKKRIEVNLATQTLTAYEDTKVVLQTKISSGMADSQRIPGITSTKTPQGEFHVESKMPSKHMGGGELTSDPEAYVLPGVPWTSFFVPDDGVAFHGTYWHDNFGTPMSHGCVNMRVEEAKWIFRWTKPFNGGDKVNAIGYGTRVIVY
ncbi:MAG: L,D-transpeptidase, partial [Anaerolineaceae bacterium]